MVRMIAGNPPGWWVKLKDPRWFVPVTSNVLCSAEKIRSAIEGGRVGWAHPQQPLETQPDLRNSGKRPLHVAVKPPTRHHHSGKATDAPAHRRHWRGQWRKRPKPHQLGPIATHTRVLSQARLPKSHGLLEIPIHVVLRGVQRGGAPRREYEGVPHKSIYSSFSYPDRRMRNPALTSQPGRSDSKNSRRSACSSDRNSTSSPVAGCSNLSKLAWRKCRPRCG